VGTAAYHPQSSWFLFGEILTRTASSSGEAQHSFADVLKQELLDPLSMSETACGIPTERLDKFTGRLPTLYERDKGQLRPSPYCETPWLTRPSPGGNLRGPIRELGTFLEMLRRGGKTVDGREMVSAATIQQMTSRQRVGQYDQTLQHVLDFGLGVICNSNRYGVDTVPYGFGRYSGEGAFGHGGSQCSMGFCDPEHGLVVAWSANGFCGEGQHQRRNRMINEAIYRDLAIAAEA
jgi:CubicO group peptidase (beta-lactamase class C family)